ncbi:uncharacterized protein LOC124420363 [Lucilia cuprina]|uniref:uncharacterized protein LOC124420363 n=1 Tax=Lucilia cuprina TaxID=7375 RepID=UPI001F05E591|nr:uncharacterized protein LOC124420363 [Lucilia cuprina]
MFKVILLLLFCAFTHSTRDVVELVNKDILDSFYEYVFQNSTYFIYHNTSALMPVTNPLVLMELFVTPLLPAIPYKLATFVVRLVRLFLPHIPPRPFVSIVQVLVENICCLKPFANLTFTLGFTTNFQTSGQFGWMG